MEVRQRTAVDTGRRASAGEVTCEQVVESHLQRLDVVNPVIDAIPVRLAEQALAKRWPGASRAASDHLSSS
jgi:Asp-tRNA(Asn)/Glu-tRNA(Gln) amidotransferase A subunit family amidase